VVSDFGIIETERGIKGNGSLPVQDEIIPLFRKTARSHPGTALEEMMHETKTVRLIGDLAVIGDEIPLEPRVDRLALRQLAVEDETVSVSTDVHERLDFAFDIAKAGRDRFLIERTGDVVGHLAVEIADAIRPGETEDGAVVEREPASGDGRGRDHAID
jgi:hypothetical protein